MLTDAQKRFVELEKKKAEVKKYYEQLDQAMLAVVEEIGVEGFFQDPTDSTVYQIVKPAGVFTPYKDVGFIRTRRGYLGESKGELSLKKAEEAGFALNDNQKTVTKLEE